MREATVRERDCVREFACTIDSIIVLLFVSTLNPFVEWVHEKIPDPLRIRTESTLAESRVVLI